MNKKVTFFKQTVLLSVCGVESYKCMKCGLLALTGQQSFLPLVYCPVDEPLFQVCQVTTVVMDGNHRAGSKQI